MPSRVEHDRAGTSAQREGLRVVRTEGGFGLHAASLAHERSGNGSVGKTRLKIRKTSAKAPRKPAAMPIWTGADPGAAVAGHAATARPARCARARSRSARPPRRRRGSPACFFGALAEQHPERDDPAAEPGGEREPHVGLVEAAPHQEPGVLQELRAEAHAGRTASPRAGCRTRSRCTARRTGTSRRSRTRRSSCRGRACAAA